MYNRLSLSNVQGRDDDVEEVHIRTERELRRRIRESDPTYTAKRLQAKQQQQQIERGGGPIRIPTPDQVQLQRESESTNVNPHTRSTLLMRQSAQSPYPEANDGNASSTLNLAPKKPNFAKWLDVANDSDVGHQNLQEKEQNENNNAAENENSEFQQQQQEKHKQRPTFLPDSHMTTLFARRCIEIGSRTASLRYRDVCNAKSPDEMGALGIDPEMMGNFSMGGFGGGAGGSNNNNASGAAAGNAMLLGPNSPPSLKNVHSYSGASNQSAAGGGGSQQQHRTPKSKEIPDNFNGVPVRGDSGARLLAYKKMREKDKMADAQRKLATQQLRLQQAQDMLAAHDNNSDNNKNDAVGDVMKDDQPSDTESSKRTSGGLSSKNSSNLKAPSAQEIFDDCAIYLKDTNPINDPGYPLPMRLGTADTGNSTFSGIDASQTDNEDLVILTTPQLRLASKTVLQCLFSLQAGDLRADSVPTNPMIQFTPVRHCPMFVQKEHTLLMHDLKSRLRHDKAAGGGTPRFVVWTRVLLSRSSDPEDDVVAADDVRVESMATVDAVGGTRNKHHHQHEDPNEEFDYHQHHKHRSVVQEKIAASRQMNTENNALFSGSATVDMMLTSPTNNNNRNVSNSNTTPQGKLVAVDTSMLVTSPQQNDNNYFNPNDPTSSQQRSARSARNQRVPPSLPVMVRAPRPILCKAPPKDLFESPIPSANEIVNEFKEFSQAIRPILNSDFDPPGASKNDADRTPTPSSEVQDDEDEEDEDEEDENGGGQRPKVPPNSEATSGVSSVSPTSKRKAAAKAQQEELQAQAKQVAVQFSMEEIYQPLKKPTTQEAAQLLSDNAPFEDVETAVMTAKCIVDRIRTQRRQSRGGATFNASGDTAGGGGGMEMGSEGEKLKFRLIEALDFVKKSTIEATTKMTRADSQAEFRFQMQESFLKREAETTGFQNAAKGIINCDQRITLLHRRLDMALDDQRQSTLRTAQLEHEIAIGRVHRERSNSPQAKEKDGRNYSQSPLVPGAIRKPVNKVNLKYAKGPEEAPPSVSNFIVENRENSENRSVEEIQPAVSPTRPGMNFNTATSHNQSSSRNNDNNNNSNNDDVDDDAPALIDRQ